MMFEKERYLHRTLHECRAMLRFVPSTEKKNRIWMEKNCMWMEKKRASAKEMRRNGTNFFDQIDRDR